MGVHEVPWPDDKTGAEVVVESGGWMRGVAIITNGLLYGSAVQVLLPRLEVGAHIPRLRRESLPLDDGVRLAQGHLELRPILDCVVRTSAE